MAKILIVEDDRNLASILKRWLGAEHHDVDVVFDGMAGLDYLRTYHCDLAIVDWTLPGLSGLELCKQVVDSGSNVRILMLTGKNTLDDKQEGFDAGADDYLTKPFHVKELLMRVRALLKREINNNQSVFQLGDLVLEPKSHKLTKAGKEIHVSPREFLLLEFLVRNPDTVFSAETLLARLWESDSDTTTATVRTFIKQLRKKIDTPGQPSIIENVHGVGYKVHH